MERTIGERILTRISSLENDIEKLRECEMEIATSGTASATLSSGGGSKSYTRLDIDKIHTLIRAKEVELARLRARLNGGSGIRRIMFVR